MMSRRQFISAAAAAAGTALFARIPNVLAQSYQLIIRGGRVIDPSIGLDAIRDVAIAGGRIVAVEPNIAVDAPDVIDARGKIVAPGLIDIHSHAGRTKEGPPLCLQDGVTGWVDAGSAGADNIDQVAAVARGAPQIGCVPVNISRTGVDSAAGELNDLNKVSVDLARGAIARHRDVVVGVKARLSASVGGANDLEALRRAQEAAAPFNLPVMIHVGQNFSPMRAILPLLKRGDIVTHLYAPPRHHFRFRQWGQRPLHLGHGGAHDEAGFLARYDIHRLERQVARNQCCRLPKRDVEVPHVRHAAEPDHRVRDGQLGAHVPGVRRPWHVEFRRAGGRGDHGAQGRRVRVRGQLQRQAHRQAVPLPGRYRALWEARCARVTI
jgi:hypothetical protein